MIFSNCSSQNAVFTDGEWIDGEWIGLESRALTERSSIKGYTPWHLSKDHLQVDDVVRSRKPLNARRPRTLDVSEGTVVGLDGGTERSGFVLLKLPGLHNPLKVHESVLERVTSGFAAGDWVSLKNPSNRHSSVGILHSVHRDGSVAVGFIGLETLWRGKISEVQMAKPYYIGQFVRVKDNISAPRFEWPTKRRGGWATGRISQVLPNGCLLAGFPGLFSLGNEPNSFLADPAEVEVVSFDTCPGVVGKYQHIEDYHWSIRPVAIALGLLTTVKLGLSIGRNVKSRLQKRCRNSPQEGCHTQEGCKAGWIPSPVANIIFRDGVTTASGR